MPHSEAAAFVTASAHPGGLERGRISGVVVSACSVLVCAALLLWPALLNGYPLLFGDTGVYLRDGIRMHMSWPRPLFYGLFMLPLHLERTVWPVVIAQALITAGTLLAAMRCFLPGLSAWMLIPAGLALTVGTSLPWFVSQLMPDIFGGLMVLTLAILLLSPRPLRPGTQLLIILFAAACITMHLSFLPISLAVLVVLLLCRAWLRLKMRPVLVRGALVPVIAVLVATLANAQLTGQVSPSPYGKIFVLTRILLDGPGHRALDRECPQPGWTLCAYKNQLPTTEDRILFGDDGIVTKAGGYRVVAPQAMPIIAAALRAEPVTMLADAARNTVRQFFSFRSGDALVVPMAVNETAWRETFPNSEQDRYLGEPAIPAAPARAGGAAGGPSCNGGDVAACPSCRVRRRAAAPGCVGRRLCGDPGSIARECVRLRRAVGRVRPLPEPLRLARAVWGGTHVARLVASAYRASVACTSPMGLGLANPG